MSSDKIKDKIEFFKKLSVHPLLSSRQDEIMFDLATVPYYPAFKLGQLIWAFEEALCITDSLIYPALITGILIGGEERERVSYEITYVKYCTYLTRTVDLKAISEKVTTQELFVSLEGAIENFRLTAEEYYKEKEE